MENNTESGRAPDADASSSIVDILKNIDKRLEIITKILGYLSFFVLTPTVFFLSYLGFDFNSMLGIKELTPAQQESVSQIRMSGYEPDPAGAALALSNNDPIFGRYLAAEIYPVESEAKNSLAKQFQGNLKPSSDPDLFKGYLRKFPELSTEIKKKLDERKSFISSFSTGRTFNTTSEFCEAAASFLANGDYGKPVSGDADCEGASMRGTQIVHLIDALTATRIWNDFLGKSQPSNVSEAALVDIARLPEKENLGAQRTVTKFDPNIKNIALDGTVYRFKTEMFTKQPPIFYEQTRRYGMAVHDQVTPPVLINGTSLVYVEFPGIYVDSSFRSCDYLDEICIMDFSTIVLGGKFVPIQIISKEVVRDIRALKMGTVVGW